MNKVSFMKNIILRTNINSFFRERYNFMYKDIVVVQETYNPKAEKLTY